MTVSNIFLSIVVYAVSWHVVLAQQELTSVILLAKLCNWRQSQNKTIFETFYYQQIAKNMQSCTKNNIIIPNIPSKNILINIGIPCSFNSMFDNTNVIDNTKLNSTNTYDFIHEWMSYAMKQANSTLNGAINTYKYKLLIMPKNNVIPWRGLGTLGDVYSWYNTHDLDVSLYLHELGHNFGFGHAMKDGKEYGDTSCIMGSGSRCYTAPHRHYMQWDSPLMSLNWDINHIDVSYWNTSINMRKIGEYVVINNDIYIEAISFETNVYILQQNMSTSHVCKISKNLNTCFIPNYDLVIKEIYNNLNDNTIMIEIVYSKGMQPYTIRQNNSAANTILYIYDKLCIAFITYNIIAFLTKTIV
jgi:hypothetical protein